MARAYLACLRTDADRDTAQANVELSTALLQLAQRQKTAGTGTGIDVTRAEVQLANDRQRLIRAGDIDAGAGPGRLLPLRELEERGRKFDVGLRGIAIGVGPQTRQVGARHFIRHRTAGGVMIQFHRGQRGFGGLIFLDVAEIHDRLLRRCSRVQHIKRPHDGGDGKARNRDFETEAEGLEIRRLAVVGNRHIDIREERRLGLGYLLRGLLHRFLRQRHARTAVRRQCDFDRAFEAQRQRRLRHAQVLSARQARDQEQNGK